MDRVVALVENRPITASQVALEHEIRGRIEQSARPEDFGRLLTESVSTLEALIFREILRGKNRNSELRGDEEQARHRLRIFERGFENRQAVLDFRARWNLERGWLLDYFRESVTLDQQVELSLNFRVLPEEERQYYEVNKERMFGGRPFEEVSDYVEEQVYQLKLEDEYNRWKARLRSAANKRYLGREGSLPEELP